MLGDQKAACLLRQHHSDVRQTSRVACQAPRTWRLCHRGLCVEDTASGQHSLDGQHSLLILPVMLALPAQQAAQGEDGSWKQSARLGLICQQAFA